MSRKPLIDQMPAGKPDAEIDIDQTLVEQLLKEQHPDLAKLPLKLADSGWDNVIYRLSDHLAVRLPRRKIAAELARNEQIWLPTLAPRLPIPTPVPARIGKPSSDYPWHWSVVPWFEGECADVAAVAGAEARRFAEFLIELHQPAPANAPKNPVRGVPLRIRQANTAERMTRVRSKTDLISPALETAWAAALDAPDAKAPRWLHGDLHAQNVLVDENGRITAIIDWGDITGGDVATDLAGIWALYESAEHRAWILGHYAPDAATLSRARGWAFLFGVVLVDSGLINSPRHANAGKRILERLEADVTQNL